MNMRRSEQRRRQAAEQAAEWLIALRSGKLSSNERSEFADWLRESPLHVAEMLRISRIDHALGEYTQWSEVPVAPGSDTDNVVALGVFTPAKRQYKSTRVALLPWATAAGLAAVAMLSAWLFISHGQSVIRTQVGERREITLADGSVVDIAPATEIRVRLEDKQRLIKLMHGQAFFHVAKDAARPFIVDAGGTQVRAVGTAFDVERSVAGVTVTVLEGRVAVARDPSTTQRAIGPKQADKADVYLVANEQMVVTASVAETPVRTVDSAAEVAWTDGNLVFNDETVAEVIRRFNLYNRAQIHIQDQTLATRRVSGIFKSSDPESFIAFLRSTVDDASYQHDEIRLTAPAQ